MSRMRWLSQFASPKQGVTLPCMFLHTTFAIAHCAFLFSPDTVFSLCCGTLDSFRFVFIAFAGFALILPKAFYSPYLDLLFLPRQVPEIACFNQLRTVRLLIIISITFCRLFSVENILSQDCFWVQLLIMISRSPCPDENDERKFRPDLTRQLDGSATMPTLPLLTAKCSQACYNCLVY